MQITPIKCLTDNYAYIINDIDYVASNYKSESEISKINIKGKKNIIGSQIRIDRIKNIVKDKFL